MIVLFGSALLKNLEYFKELEKKVGDIFIFNQTIEGTLFDGCVWIDKVSEHFFTMLQSSLALRRTVLMTTQDGFFSWEQRNSSKRVQILPDGIFIEPRAQCFFENLPKKGIDSLGQFQQFIQEAAWN